MPNSTLTLKASVTHHDPAAVPPDLKVRFADLPRPLLEEVRQAAELEFAARPEPPAQDRPKRNPNTLQSAFLAANLNNLVTVYLMSGIKRVGTLKQFDKFTLWLQGSDGIESMIFKQVISTVQPGSANRPRSVPSDRESGFDRVPRNFVECDEAGKYHAIEASHLVGDLANVIRECCENGDMTS